MIDALATGVFSPDEPGRYAQIADILRHHDYYMLTADFDSYYQTQRDIDAVWNTPEVWWEKSIHNTARMGWFSSDRTIREYAKDIWGAEVTG